MPHPTSVPSTEEDVLTGVKTGINAAGAAVELTHVDAVGAAIEHTVIEFVHVGAAVEHAGIEVVGVAV